MRIPRNYRWAAARVREVWTEEGFGSLRVRAVTYLRKRRLGSGVALPPLPREPATARLWPRSVAIVADGQPAQCYRYRVQQKIAACRAMGIPIRVVSPHDPGAAHDAVQLADVLIVFRQAAHPGVAAAMGEARRLGIPVVYEADDVVYRRDLVAANPNLATVPEPLRRSVVSGTDGYLAVLQQADHVLASTPALAADMGRYVAGRSFVMDNGIDAQMDSIAAALSRDPAPPVREPDTVVIGYGSGSRAHDSDLAVAADGLAAVMAADPRVRLHLVGPVKIPEVLTPFANRVRVSPELPYPEYLRQLAACDITIAPLLDLPFNRFKSQVKVLEAAVVGVPLVASRVLYSDYVDDGQTGLLASPLEWEKALGRMVADADLREGLASRAREASAEAAVERRPTRQFAELLDALCPSPAEAEA